MECARLVLRPVAWLLGLALGGKKRDKIDADAAEHDATDTRPPHDPAFNPDCVVLFGEFLLGWGSGWGEGSSM